METILVVDDNDLVLKAVVLILERAKFRVLSAASGPEAVILAKKPLEKIDLLLSDIEMPEMSGPELADILKANDPALHIMFMSGGDKGNLLVLNYGWAYIQKPFVAVKLVEMVTHVINSVDLSQSTSGFDSRKEEK